ncbi:MAG: flippase-like domain-containing protein [Planctomycetes bacterium]|nr:flippase-like domain-containing protein [Planctomycetota bacterium]
MLYYQDAFTFEGLESAAKLVVKPLTWACIFVYVVSHYFGMAFRWQILLSVKPHDISFARSVKLMWIGDFYSQVIPGTISGDFVKAYLAAKNSNDRARVALSVLVDRIAGLVGLLTLAFVTVCYLYYSAEHRDELFHMLVILLGCMVAFILGSLVYFSSKARRILRIDKIIAKLPFSSFLKSVDAAILIYKDHKARIFVSVGLSILIQLFGLGAFYFAAADIEVNGVTFAEQISLYEFLAVLIVMIIVSVGIPVPGGWGAGDALFAGVALSLFNVEAWISTPASLFIRAIILSTALFGAILYLFEKDKVKI